MGKIVSTNKGLDGVETSTEVHVNKLEEFMFNVARLFGRERMWRLIHFVERRKLGR